MAASSARSGPSAARFTPAQVQRSVAAGTAALIDSLVGQGRLRRSGPITDSEVCAMVFVAVATGELVREVLDRRPPATPRARVVIPAEG